MAVFNSDTVMDAHSSTLDIRKTFISSVIFDLLPPFLSGAPLSAFNHSLAVLMLIPSVLVTAFQSSSFFHASKTLLLSFSYILQYFIFIFEQMMEKNILRCTYILFAVIVSYDCFSLQLGDDI